MAFSITWQQLRKLAEAAHGQPDQHLGIRFDVASNDFVIEPYDPVNAGEYILTVRPKPPAPKQGKLEVRLPGIKTQNLRVKPPNDDFFSIADAVFWSASAVRKFLVPYYASYWDLQDVMTKIEQEFARDDVLAFIHLPNSEILDDGDAQPASNLFSVRQTPGPDGGYELKDVQAPPSGD
jgi:hypothetical protein